MKQILYWAWISFAAVDAFGGVIGWLELRRERPDASRYLAHVLLAGGWRSVTTIIGLYLFGLNLKAESWYLWLGVSAVAYKGYSTWGWLMYLHGIIGHSWWDLFKRKK